MTRRLVRPEVNRVGTTVVGSYPIPAWLAALPSAPNRGGVRMIILEAEVGRKSEQ